MTWSICVACAVGLFFLLKYFLQNQNSSSSSLSSKELNILLAYPLILSLGIIYGYLTSRGMGDNTLNLFTGYQNSINNNPHWNAEVIKGAILKLNEQERSLWVLTDIYENLTGIVALIVCISSIAMLVKYFDNTLLPKISFKKLSLVSIIFYVILCLWDALRVLTYKDVMESKSINDSVYMFDQWVSMEYVKIDWSIWIDVIIFFIFLVCLIFFTTYYNKTLDNCSFTVVKKAFNLPQGRQDLKTKRCPYCGEEILAIAKKCRYCGEWLDQTEMESEQSEEHIDGPETSSSENQNIAEAEQRTKPTENIKNEEPTPKPSVTFIESEVNKSSNTGSKFIFQIIIAIVLLIVTVLLCIWLAQSRNGDSRTSTAEEYYDSAVDSAIVVEEYDPLKDSAIVVEEYDPLEDSIVAIEVVEN